MEYSVHAMILNVHGRRGTRTKRRATPVRTKHCDAQMQRQDKMHGAEDDLDKG